MQHQYFDCWHLSRPISTAGMAWPPGLLGLGLFPPSNLRRLSSLIKISGANPVGSLIASGVIRSSLVPIVFVCGSGIVARMV